jgi:hypothetical protein
VVGEESGVGGGAKGFAALILGGGGAYCHVERWGRRGWRRRVAGKGADFAASGGDGEGAMRWRLRGQWKQREDLGINPELA